MPAPIRFYLDEHVAAAVARGLRSRGIDVLTVPEAGMRGAPDDAHLDRARREGRVLYSQDDDYLRLHATGADHAGIVYAPRRTTIGHTVHGLVSIHRTMSAEQMLGRVEFLPRPRSSTPSPNPEAAQ